MSDAFENNPSVWITSFWGFDPKTWGCIGFTMQGRTKTVIAKTTDPFIMVIYVTENAPETTPENIRGKVVGFYEVTHESGSKEQFMTKEQAAIHAPKKWKYALRASRAWQILPEYMPNIRGFDPTMHHEGRERSVSAYGEVLRPSLIDKLVALPRRQVEVYGSNAALNPAIIVPGQIKGYVRSGPFNGSGYVVPPEGDSEKELYILNLCGDVSAFLGESAMGQKIIKVGLSISPETRRATFQKALPNGAFAWAVDKSTLADGNARYSDHATAETGEMAMKQYLAKNGRHLGGEFYLATPDAIENAWQLGHESAQNFQKKRNNDV